MPLRNEIKEQITAIFQKFLRERMKQVRRLRIEDLNINPFLMRLLAREMGLEDASFIIRWLVTQRSMTGTNTSFGFCLQEIAKLFSEGTGVEGADLLRNKDGRHYHIQVKSGPATMDKDAVQHMSQLLVAAQRRNRGSVAVLGMCYGTREQVMSTVTKYIQVDWYIGRDFWEFISDDPDCISEIYNIAGDVSETYRDTEGHTLAGVLQAKITELQTEFEKLYGVGGKSMWDNLLDKNS